MLDFAFYTAATICFASTLLSVITAIMNDFESSFTLWIIALLSLIIVLQL